jgi:hypothetical protein
MKGRFIKLCAALLALLAWSSSVYAGCTNAQIAGSWDVVFSDGNSCRLVLDTEGAVLIDGLSLSICFDPFRGTTAPDEGAYAVAPDCSITFDVKVEGANLQMFGRLTAARKFGAGFYVLFVPEVFADKGSFNLMRVE